MRVLQALKGVATPPEVVLKLLELWPVGCVVLCPSFCNCRSINYMVTLDPAKSIFVVCRCRG